MRCFFFPGNSTFDGAATVLPGEVLRAGAFETFA